VNKEQLKKTLKPLIKECIKEVIFEEGVLSGIISEVVKGTGTQQIVETRKAPQPNYDQMHQQDYEERRRKLQENKRKMLDSIGKNAYNGVDLFAGTEPLREGRSTGRKRVVEGKPVPHGANALDGVDPNDPGVNLAALGLGGMKWKM